MNSGPAVGCWAMGMSGPRGVCSDEVRGRDKKGEKVVSKKLEMNSHSPIKKRRVWFVQHTQKIKVSHCLLPPVPVSLERQPQLNSADGQYRPILLLLLLLLPFNLGWIAASPPQECPPARTRRVAFGQVSCTNLQSTCRSAPLEIMLLDMAGEETVVQWLIYGIYNSVWTVDDAFALSIAKLWKRNTRSGHA